MPIDWLSIILEQGKGSDLKPLFLKICRKFWSGCGPKLRKIPLSLEGRGRG
jgi:hypothetical protein